MYNKIKQAIAFFAATAAMASCVDDLNLNVTSQSKLDEVYFTASIAEQDFFGMRYAAKTRSAVDEQMRVKSGFYDLPIDGRNDLKLSVATLDGMFGKATPIPEVGKSNAMTRGMLLTELQQQPMSVLEIGMLSDGKKVVGEPYTAYTVDGATWGGSHIEHNTNAVSRTLYAVYPSTESYTINGPTRTLAYTTPESATAQSDLLYATAVQSLGAENKDSVHLTFNHMLTAVRFKIGSQQLPMSVIKSITLDGITRSGTYNFTNNTWYLSSAKGMVSCDLDFNVTGVENTIINGGESTFMLLPQQLTPSAKVTIVYEDYTEGDAESQGTKTLTASLATADTPAWEAGQCITYTLMDHAGKNEYILDVDAPGDFSPAGGTQAVNVLSYRQVEGVRTPMRWIVQSYSSDGGKTWMSGGASNVPKGMAIMPTEGTSVNATPVNVTLFAADSMSAPHRDFLRYKTPVGYDGEAFDLSRHDYNNNPCAQTTANCYVIDAPGKYRIPTAYGNAIVDGKTNSEAYHDRAGYENSTKKNFMTHTGREITAPMIRNNGITLSRATLVWEDVKDLINPASIKLVDDGNAIEFEILADNIDQGNAVIAAMDGNNVAWSWHIWVTDEKASLAEPIGDENIYGEQVDFMPLTLGWCSTSPAWGAIGREAAVRITMPGHMTSRASFRIRQVSTPSEDIYNNAAGNSTYYNWGRKDPFPGAIGTDVPIGSDETANALPKPFYQAGADAAALGLHSELHAEYGTNDWALALQGALVGIDGFFTGKSIGQVINYYKRPIINTITDVKLKGLRVSQDAVPGVELTCKSEAELTLLRSKMYISATRANLDPRLVAALPEKCTPVASETFMNYSGRSITILDQSTDKISHILKITEEGDLFKLTLHTVEEVTTERVRHIGHYSTAFLVSAGKAFAASFSFGVVLANTSLFKGGTDWCKEMKSHGVSINYGILHPNILMRDPISWISYDGVGNLWNASQTVYNDKNKKVVKTIYDPCPAGYCVPSARDMSGVCDETTGLSFKASTSKTAASGREINFPSLGCRNFWSGAEPGAEVTNNINELIFSNGDQGMYWTSSPAINKDEKGEKGAYAVHFRGSDTYDDTGEGGVQYSPRVINDLKLQHSYALPIRPVRERR